MRYFTKGPKQGQPDHVAHWLAQYLGVFSLLLGIGELLFADRLAQATGLRDLAWIVYVYGAREVFTGVLILATKDPTPWIWLRVAGDALDIGTLAFGYNRDPAAVTGIFIAFMAVAGVTLVDLYCAIRLSRDSRQQPPPTKDYHDRSGLPT